MGRDLARREDGTICTGGRGGEKPAAILAHGGEGEDEGALQAAQLSK